MADNVELNAGTGGVTCATDDVAGVHYQVVKLAIGAADSATLIGNAAPVPVSDAGGTLTVDGTVAVTHAALTELAAAIDTEVQCDIVSSALPTGAATAAKQPALGTAGTASADVISIQGIASMTAVQVADNGGSLTVDNAALSVVGGGAEATALRVTLASDSTGVVSVDDNGASLTVDGSVSLAAAIPAGTNNIGDVDILTIAAGDNNIGNVDIVTMPNVTLAAGTNTNEVVGDVAHGVAVAGNPVLIGIEGRSSDGTAVDSGDSVRPLGTLLGKIVNYPYALPGSTWNYAAPAGGLTSTTAVTIKTAAGAGIRNYITHIDCVNSHQTTSTELTINDGAAGTVLWRGWLQAAGGGYSINFDPPLRGTANTLLEIDEITATGTAGVVFNATGFTAAE